MCKLKENNTIELGKISKERKRERKEKGERGIPGEKQPLCGAKRLEESEVGE